MDKAYKKTGEKSFVWNYIERTIENNLETISENIKFSVFSYTWMKNLHRRNEEESKKGNIIIPGRNIDFDRIKENIEFRYMNDLIGSIYSSYMENLELKCRDILPSSYSLVAPVKKFNEDDARKYVASFNSRQGVDHLVLDIPKKFDDDKNLNLL